jgi:hypothetical protein
MVTTRVCEMTLTIIFSVFLPGDDLSRSFLWPLYFFVPATV